MLVDGAKVGAGQGGDGTAGLAAPTLANAVCPSTWPDCLGRAGANFTRMPVCGTGACKLATVQGGSAGGNGGLGGQGGSGAGASGGDSLGYYQGSGATVSASGVTYSLGALGSGGLNGGSMSAKGPSGVSAQHN